LYNDQDRNRDVTDKKVRRARFRLLGSLGQEHNIIAYVHRSSACTKIFKELVERIIPINNRIRWNS